MLIEFSAKNFLSLKDEQTLSLTMAKKGELVESNTFNSNLPTPAKLLKNGSYLWSQCERKIQFSCSCGGYATHSSEIRYRMATG